MWIVQSVMQALFKAKRTCPKCGKEQSIHADETNKTVKCRYCGEDMPPPKK